MLTASVRSLRSAVWPLVLCLAVPLALVSGCASPAEHAAGAPGQTQTTIYLVRHAEKGEGRDPDLTVAGHERALALVEILRHRSVDYLWSSDYRRTRQTLAPLSKARQVPLEIYNASDSQALVAAVMSHGPGLTHVIAGHSNTVPDLLDRLEAWPDAPDPDSARPDLEHDEYDRLFLVTVVSGRSNDVKELSY